MRWAVILAVVGCGDNRPAAVDGPVVDGLPDATPVGPVTLTVFADHNPRGGVAVFFQNADSSVVLATETDSNGVATAVMQSGGFVTAIERVGGEISCGDP